MLVIGRDQQGHNVSCSASNYGRPSQASEPVTACSWMVTHSCSRCSRRCSCIVCFIICCFRHMATDSITTRLVSFLVMSLLLCEIALAESMSAVFKPCFGLRVECGVVRTHYYTLDTKRTYGRSVNMPDMLLGFPSPLCGAPPSRPESDHADDPTSSENPSVAKWTIHQNVTRQS